MIVYVFRAGRLQTRFAQDRTHRTNHEEEATGVNAISVFAPESDRGTTFNEKTENRYVTMVIKMMILLTNTVSASIGL